MTNEEIAYMAGLFDGEGYVGIIMKKSGKNGKKYPSLQMSISQQRRAVLDWVYAKVEYGGVYSGGKAPGGVVYNYCATHRAAEKFLTMIYPYTKVKKAEIEAALEAAYGFQAPIV